MISQARNAWAIPYQDDNYRDLKYLWPDRKMEKWLHKVGIPLYQLNAYTILPFIMLEILSCTTEKWEITGKIVQ